jgi:hypothetical protein
VLALIALGVALVLLGPKLVEEVADRGNGGNGTPAPPAGEAIEVASVEDFDPESSGGDGVEHSEEAPLAIDDDESTFWDTEEYDNAFELSDKEGVGLLFDLGEAQGVAVVEVVTAHEGQSFEIRASQDEGSDPDDFEVIESFDAAQKVERVAVDEEYRYWLVWITGFPGGAGGEGSIAEVRFLGS